MSSPDRTLLDIDILLNEVALARIIRDHRLVFPFEADFFAGTLQLSIFQDEKLLASTDILVEASAAKLTRDEYTTMIAQISEATLALFRLGGATVPVGVAAGGKKSDVVTLELIRMNFDDFKSALRRINESPLRVLQSVNTEVGIHDARRLDDYAVEAALRGKASRKASASESVLAPDLVNALRGQWITKLVERRREETVDTYENRALLGFLRSLDGQLAAMSKRLSSPAQAANVDSRIIAVQRDRIAKWRSQIADLARRSMFRDLRPDFHLRPTSAFRKKRSYAAAFSAMTKMRAGLGGNVAIIPAVSIERTFVLYEMWCLVMLLRVVAEQFPLSRSAISNILRGCAMPADLGVRLLQGDEAAVPLNETTTLRYQKRYSPQTKKTSGWTHLVEVIPDIVFEKKDQDGKILQVIVLDPKYRTGKSLLDGLRDLHVYRDAILGHDSTRLVYSAIALAPRVHSAVATLETELPRSAPGLMVSRPSHDVFAFQNVIRLVIEAFSH